MKVISLPDVLHEYLLQMIEAHAARGIHPEEGLAINRLWDAVKNRATHIDDAAMAKMAAAGAPLTPDQEETNRVRCEAGGPLPMVQPMAQRFDSAGDPPGRQPSDPSIRPLSEIDLYDNRTDDDHSPNEGV